MEASIDTPRRPVVVDLFAGAGGLSLGFEMAGFDVVAAVEYDPVHAATHSYNFPLAPVLCRDVRRVQPADLVAAAEAGWKLHNPSSEWDGVIDVVVGGPSCQGFSSMGRQDANDDRNELVSEFVRLVEGLSPRAFVMENVPGILAPQFEALIAAAVERLRKAGYTLKDYTEPLDAADFGVPQRRKRVFIVGVAEDYELSPILKSTQAAVVSDAFAGLPDLTGRRKADGELLEMSETQAAEYARGMGTPYLQTLSEMAPRHSTGLVGVLSGYLVTEHSPESIRRFVDLPQGGTDKTSRLWRLRESGLSRTLRAGTGSERGSFSAARPLHPVEPRVITVREAARLHSFPDWFRFHVTNWHAHRQIGNSVPPLMAKAVAESVRRALKAPLLERFMDAARLESASALLTMNASEAKAHFEAEDEEVPAKRRRLSSKPRVESRLIDAI